MWDPASLLQPTPPGVAQPRLLKRRQALEILDGSTSTRSSDGCSSPRTSCRQCQEPSQLPHPQISSGSEKNLIFPLQGEEERWKNRIRYAQMREKPLPLPPSTDRVCLSFGVRTSERLLWPLHIKFRATSMGRVNHCLLRHEKIRKNKNCDKNQEF